MRFAVFEGNLKCFHRVDGTEFNSSGSILLRRLLAGLMPKQRLRIWAFSSSYVIIVPGNRLVHGLFCIDIIILSLRS